MSSSNLGKCSIVSVPFIALASEELVNGFNVRSYRLATCKTGSARPMVFDSPALTS